MHLVERRVQNTWVLPFFAWVLSTSVCSRGAVSVSVEPSAPLPVAFQSTESK